MSKDKGNKNNKKAPADKAGGKAKVLSTYQKENLNTPPQIFSPKVEPDKAKK